MAGPVDAGPTRTQKRWAGRLRTGGALVLLLAAVGTVDHLVGLAAPSRRPDALGGGDAVPVWVIVACAAVGAAAFALGRKWRR